MLGVEVVDEVDNNIEDEQTPKLRGTVLNFINKFYNKELSQHTYL